MDYSIKKVEKWKNEIEWNGWNEKARQVVYILTPRLSNPS